MSTVRELPGTAGRAGGSGAPARLRILVVGPVPPPWHGGSAVTRMLLRSPLAEQFDIVHVETSDRRSVDNVGRLDPANVWLAGVHAARFASLLVRSRADIVYLPVAQNVLGFMRDALFMAPALMRGVPLVLHFHSGGYRDFVHSAPAPLRVLIRTLLGRAHRAIVLGQGLAHMLDGIVPANRIVVVPNGVPDLPHADSPPEARSTLRVLFLGNLIPSKGYVELLDAVQRLRGEGADVTVTFAGSVIDARVHARALATIPAGADYVRFAGPVDEEQKAALLRAADVVALPSYYEYEAHPLVLLEAMAAGLPVIATRHVAIPEIVLDGETGVLVERRDVRGLATALRTLAVQPDTRARMGRAARVRYLEQFTVAQWSERMATVFQSIPARVVA